MLLKLLSSLKKNPQKKLSRGKPIKRFLRCCFSAAGEDNFAAAGLSSDMKLIQIRIKSIGKNRQKSLRAVIKQTPLLLWGVVIVQYMNPA